MLITINRSKLRDAQEDVDLRSFGAENLKLQRLIGLCL
jgi:hypothetical protein